EVLGAGFGGDGEALGAGGGDALGGLGGADVEDVEAGAGECGDVDGATGGFAFHDGGAAAGMPARLGVAEGEVAADEFLDDVPVFGVDDGPAVYVADGFEGAEELVVAE